MADNKESSSVKKYY